jgi:hypothetical protein
MKIRFLLLVSAIAAGLLWMAGGSAPRSGFVAMAEAAAPPKLPGACTFPTSASASPAETAWRIFVAANCPANANQVVWETWIEQQQLYPASAALKGGKRRRLHASPLLLAEARKKGLIPQLTPSTECNKMAAPPDNVVAGATVCEEVRINPSAAAFITGNGYQVRSGQIKAAVAGTDIQFPTAAIEVKVDWIPATDFKTPFTCANPPQGVHVELIDGVCYAMAGMHISSKLLPDWIWATFEPQSMLTNPNRCITFGSCNDPFGSNPATSNGGASGFTQQTLALKALMQAANLAPEFYNYRMDGVQTTFGTAQNPTLLGNSIIEGENVGMKTGTASCITCHSVSSIKKDGTDGITEINDQVGPEYQVPAGWIARDFVWSLALACPGGIQSCSSTPVTTAKKAVTKVKTKTTKGR